MSTVAFRALPALTLSSAASDIGGILPGSMPPNSTTIFQEGACVESFKIVRKGIFDQAGLVHHLVDVPASYEGCSGTRCLRDVLSDLQAQIAANNKGIRLIYASKFRFEVGLGGRLGFISISVGAGS